MSKEIPYSTFSNPYTDTVTILKTAKDIKKLIENVPDDTPVYIFGHGGYNTVYDVEAEYKTQQCIEHSGKIHEVTGIIIQVEG